MRILLSLIPLIIVAAVVYAVVRAARGRHRTPGVVAPRAESPAVDSGLSGLLDGWAAAGLLSADQVAAILAHEAAKAAVPGSPRRRMPALAEALGYLGGALACVGAVLLLTRYWADISTAGRLAITAGLALALLGAAALIRAPGAELERLRAVVWLASSAATCAFAVIAVHEALDVTKVQTVLVAGSGAVALQSGLLWRGRTRPAQQLAFLAAAIVLLGAAAGHLDSPHGWAGVVVVATGAALVAIGLRRLLPSALTTEALGAVAMVAGAITMSVDWQAAGLLLGVGASLALAAVAVIAKVAPNRGDALVLGILGGVTLLEATPAAAVYFAEHAAGPTGLVMYLAGAALIALAAARLVRVPDVVAAAGAVALFGGAAVTFGEWHGFAPILGAATAVVLIALGTLPRQFELSLLGSAGLLGNVPWLIAWFFPGEGRVPVLTLASGAVIIAVAVFLARMSGRFGSDLGLHHRVRHP